MVLWVKEGKDRERGFRPAIRVSESGYADVVDGRMCEEENVRCTCDRVVGIRADVVDVMDVVDVGGMWVAQGRGDWVAARAVLCSSVFWSRR